MLQLAVPKLPMRDKAATRHYYIDMLGFAPVSEVDYDGYLMVQKDGVELHFFAHNQLQPEDNYVQVYIRVTDIEELYNELQARGVAIHPYGKLGVRPWGQKEFALLDPDSNLLTFGEGV